MTSCIYFYVNIEIEDIHLNLLAAELVDSLLRKQFPIFHFK